MFRKAFSLGGLLLLAGALVLVTPGSGQAQHRGGVVHPGFRGGFMPGFRGGFDPRFNRGMFDPRFNRGFFDPRFTPGFFPGFVVPF